MKLITAVLGSVAADAVGARLVDEGVDFMRVDRDEKSASLLVKTPAEAADRVCMLIAEVARAHRGADDERGLLLVKDIPEP